MIAVVHAFSRRNAGDSLLVDLTIRYLEQAGVPRDECWVFALDPDSFRDLPHVVKVPSEPWGRVRMSVLAAGVQLLESVAFWLSGGRIVAGRVAKTLAAADGIVAVGGGYLRTPTVVNSLGVLLNHLPQLAIAAVSEAPSIYLPQSIGPLPGPAGAVALHLLRHVDTVYARDDWTLDEIGQYRPVERMPDLAVLALGEQGITPRSRDGSGRTILVGRRLRAEESYVRKLRQLHRGLQRPEWALQATGPGRRSDSRFYEELGVTESGHLADALSEGRGVVVSVRLHGALQAIMEGWPAIHLAYDRKGWGAFEDLNLEKFVHPARGFDPATVLRQARALAEDPEPYWDRIRDRLPDLRSAARSLQQRLHRFAARSGAAPGR